MTLDIKTTAYKPVRQTFANIAARFGEDRTATRYEEATYDLQPTVNFHYRPTWDPSRELYDERATRIVMEDWYALLDPRQYYYGTYTIARNKLMEAAEANLAYVEKGALLDGLSDDLKAQAVRILVPLRHYCWGANMNNFQIARMGYGTAVTQATSFAAMDQLGMAQILSRIGLMMDGMTGRDLDEAKRIWLEDEIWQPLRHVLEDSFVLEDWAEQLLLQNMVLDGLIFPLWFDEIDAHWTQNGAIGLSLSAEFMRRWHAEHQRWVDATIKRIASESDENAALLAAWVKTWMPRAVAAVSPVAKTVFGAESAGVLNRVSADLLKRLKKAGLDLTLEEVAA